ncbi:hypothetical protein, partial [Tessaracoccus defluvii]
MSRSASSVKPALRPQPQVARHAYTQTAPTTTANSQVGGVMPLWQSWTFDDVGNRLTSKVNKVVAASALVPSS